MKKEETIDMLNPLIVIDNDRNEDYEIVSEETEKADLKIMFFQFSQISQKCKHEFIIELQKLDGMPIEGIKKSGKFFKIWMDAKAALTGKDY